MKWPWQRRGFPEPPPENEEQRAAVQRHVDAASERQCRVDAVVRDTERLRARNNFGPTIARALGAPHR